MPAIHKNILVTGKVQGVYFRASAKQKAVELGLKGFVANRPDGSVYAEAEGAELPVSLFIDWCRKGPASAEVDKLQVTEGPVKNFSDFHIAR